MGTGGLSSRNFAIPNWSRSNRRSHRRTRWASGASCLQLKASTTLSLACAATAPNSSARWPSTRTSTDSATCEALRGSSSRWPKNSSEAFTAFGLESRYDEQTATDRNQVLEQSNVELWLAQGPYEPSAGLI